ncbi:glycoside hydrolase family 9 protein [Kribbella sp. HUAS MG21]|uniref:Glycoside hydrolase family 9 protein n=1 Tax=Kribbella sp. HUAS MG21 TaxID=3160966 RepID=A0AAU7TA24_9ACTN
MRFSRRVLGVLTTAGLVSGLVVGPLGAAEAAGGGVVRVNQLGYGAFDGKAAYVMTRDAATGVRFQVVDRHGRRVLTGPIGADAGEWNATYRHVYQLDLSTLKTPGSYRLEVPGAAAADFEVRASSARLRTGAKDKAVGFFTAQRDTAHHNDRAASVYETPEFAGPDTDQTVGELRQLGGPVDVSGGWYDAGDYLKFTHIAAYSDSLLWASARDRRDRTVLAEARHGLDWLDRMWDERTRTLYIQVGVGTGNVEGTFIGDHDIWRLPGVDDNLTDPSERHLRNRPVFRAAVPGQPISPNLAGRTAAAFALAAQVEPNRATARRHLETAAQIFAQAKTENVGQLVTSLPFAFYPETAWRDDLELGATELALAARRLGDRRAGAWLRRAGHWATQYLEHEAGGDTLNLYDVSALAHADLIRAASADRPLVRRLAGDLRAQLEIGAARAKGDPFRAGAQYDNFDAVPHAFGLAATARLYRQTTGDRRYDDFGQQQLDWTFGANPWGVSFMIGVGRTAERCPHHQIANITGRELTGAVVNGPNSAGLFEEGLGDHLDGMNPCPADGVDRYAEFTGRGSRYVDDVRSWQASEPADDFAAIAVYALT